MKRVLMISGDFVPVSSNNTFRALGFAEELPLLGWEPLVLSRKPARDSFVDGSLRSSSRVIRSSDNFKAVSLLKRIPPTANYLRFPDRLAPWIPSASLIGLYLCLRNRVDAIFASFQPYSALVVATTLQRLLGKPLILDFRDPVIDLQRTGDTSRDRHINLVRKSLAHASYISAVTEEVLKDVNSLRNIPASHTSVIPHCYRQIDFRPWSPTTSEANFRVLFAGNLYEDESVQHFCSGIALASTQDPTFRERLRITLAGQFKLGAESYFFQQLQKYGLVDSVEILPWQTQSELQQLVERSQVSLCFDFDTSRLGKITPAKLSKLLAYGKPILALATPNGETHRVITESGAGITVDSLNPGAIAEALLRLNKYSLTGQLPFTRNDRFVQKYSCAYQATQLAAALDLISTQRNGLN